MPEIYNCPICLNPADVQTPARDKSFEITCELCGEYQISRTAANMNLGEYGPRHILSGAVRNRFEKDEKLDLSSTTVKTLADSVAIPEDPFESIDLLLQHLLRKSREAGSTVILSQKTDYPLLYASSPEEFQFYIDKARQLEFIETGRRGQQGY